MALKGRNPVRKIGIDCIPCFPQNPMASIIFLVGAIGAKPFYRCLLYGGNTDRISTGCTEEHWCWDIVIGLWDSWKNANEMQIMRCIPRRATDIWSHPYLSRSAQFCTNKEDQRDRLLREYSSECCIPSWEYDIREGVVNEVRIHLLRQEGRQSNNFVCQNKCFKCPCWRKVELSLFQV